MHYLNTKRRSRPKNVEPLKSPSLRDSPKAETSKNNQQNVVLKCVDKYITLARAAMGQGDRVLAETYYQYAEHYVRLNK